MIWSISHKISEAIGRFFFYPISSGIINITFFGFGAMARHYCCSGRHSNRLGITGIGYKQLRVL
jgi:hypothetical protein